MNSAHARRGPDGEGIYAWNSATLGHRRLAVFDVSVAGHQPMVSEDGTVGIVFNGSIYNFRELRHELERNGCRFRSHTDTEVLLEGYRLWGLKRLLARIVGMFAFGIWDDRERKLILVRDRLGVKPLLYAEKDGRLVFASSAAAFRAAGLASDLDPAAVAEFLEFGYVTDDRCIYKGFAKLPAATVLEWRDGKSRLWSYWAPCTVSHWRQMDFEDAVAETERLLLTAVKRRLFADVPVAALLSAGIDSSLICWAITQVGGDITAFTIATPGDPGDESAEARQAAVQLGIEHRVLECTDADLPGFADHIAAFGEPFACASALGMLKLSAVIAGSATVLLTGDGGDDAFLGYPEHLHLWWAQQAAAWIPPAAASGWRGVRRFVPGSGKVSRAKHFVDYATGGLGAVTQAHQGLPAFQKDGLLGPRLKEAVIASRELPWSLQSARAVLSEFLEYDRKTRFVGEYLTKVDGATMFHGLEARSPFLDTDLWEHASSLQYSVRLRGNVTKAVLRELARRKIGDRVASGRKRGFGIPVCRWLTGQWRTAFNDAFQDSTLDQEGWLESRGLRRRLEACRKGDEAPVRLWYAYVLENWRRRDLRATPPSAVQPSVMAAGA